MTKLAFYTSGSVLSVRGSRTVRVRTLCHPIKYIFMIKTDVFSQCLTAAILLSKLSKTSQHPQTTSLIINLSRTSQCGSKTAGMGLKILFQRVKLTRMSTFLELFKASSLNHLLILIIVLIDHKGAEYSGSRSQSVTLRSTLEDFGKTFPVTLQF